MAKSKPKKRSLNDLSRQMPSAAEFQDSMDQLDVMDDRAAALILAAILDNLLEMAIEVNLVALSDQRRAALFRSSEAPLSTFSAKIAIAHALGVYGEDFRRQIDKMRTIRNAFAHAMLPISFDEPVVLEECRKLEPQRLTELEYRSENDTPKERFLATGQMLAGHLMKYTHRVAQLNLTMGRRQPSPDKFAPLHPRKTDSPS